MRNFLKKIDKYRRSVLQRLKKGLSTEIKAVSSQLD